MHSIKKIEYLTNMHTSDHTSIHCYGGRVLHHYTFYSKNEYYSAVSLKKRVGTQLGKGVSKIFLHAKFA